jgi:hypothetical protein
VNRILIVLPFKIYKDCERIRLLQIVIEAVLHCNEGDLMLGAYEIMDDDPNMEVRPVLDILYSLYNEFLPYRHFFVFYNVQGYQLEDIIPHPYNTLLKFYQEKQHEY